jgi:UMP-CMP kinase
VFIIDGFPRNFDNINGWNEVFQPPANIIYTIVLECDQETCVKRLTSRSEGRDDDKIEIIKKRFNTNEKESVPVIEEMKKYSEVVKFNSNKTPEEVYSDVVVYLDKIKK